MLKEIKVVGVCSGRPYEVSYMTEDELVQKVVDGWNMIGFRKVGKTRNTWCPISGQANVTELTVYEATTGRKLYKL